ncbi:hypothetical protein Tco_0958598 [Tanacetum coccineum]
MIERESMALVPVGINTNCGYEFQNVYGVTGFIVTPEWQKFNNRNFSLDSRKEFRKRFLEIRIKEIECPKGLNFEEFGALHEVIALQNLNQFCHVSYEQDDRRFTSQAWNRDHIEELDVADTMVFQLGGERRSMTIRQSWPINYDPTLYVLNITTRANYDTRHPPSYTSIRNPIRRLVHRLLTLSVAVSVDVPSHVAKFLCDKAKGSKRKILIVGAHLIGNIASYYGLMTLGALMNVTLGPETSSMSVAKLVDLGICKYNGLGTGEMVAEIPEVARDDDDRAGHAKIEGVGRHPNMYNANRLRAMDERLGEIVNDVNELTYVVSGMSDHLSQRLAHHHIDHTHYDGTRYSYVPDIPDLGVQQGVNFMSDTPGYSTAPSPSVSQFGMFSDAHLPPLATKMT